MIVMFTSLSEKNALYVTRRILDAYAERVGKDTWKTNITGAGYVIFCAVKQQKALPWHAIT